jgi:hypothetical protein
LFHLKGEEESQYLELFMQGVAFPGVKPATLYPLKFQPGVSVPFHRKVRRKNIGNTCERGEIEETSIIRCRSH